jgi:hypothetical protein
MRVRPDDRSKEDDGTERPRPRHRTMSRRRADDDSYFLLVTSLWRGTRLRTRADSLEWIAFRVVMFDCDFEVHDLS